MHRPRFFFLFVGASGLFWLGFKWHPVKPLGNRERERRRRRGIKFMLFPSRNSWPECCVKRRNRFDRDLWPAEGEGEKEKLRAWLWFLRLRLIISIFFLSTLRHALKTLLTLNLWNFYVITCSSFSSGGCRCFSREKVERPGTAGEATLRRGGGEVACDPPSGASELQVPA